MSRWSIPANPYLRDDFARRWGGRDPFAEVSALAGVVYRQLNGRTTFRFELDGRGYFAKVFRGVGWREIFKNLLMLRAPVVDARGEFGAATALAEAGVKTLTIAAYGASGWNPAARRSFLISDEIGGVVSLEDFCLGWADERPSATLKRELLEKVAELTRTMHGIGVNHRDLYLCHLLLALPQNAGVDKLHDGQLYLIDLHRAQKRRRVPRRWLVKDLGSLYYSAMEIGLTRRDLLRFASCYFQQPVRQVLIRRAKLLRDIERRAQALYVKGKRLGILPRQVAARDRSAIS